MKITEKGWDRFAEVKITTTDCCQACGNLFETMSIVCFAPLDNNLICKKCAMVHESVEPRLFVGEIYD